VEKIQILRTPRHRAGSPAGRMAASTTCAYSRVTTPLSGIGDSSQRLLIFATTSLRKKNLRYFRIAGESKASLEETNEILATTYDGFVTR